MAFPPWYLGRNRRRNVILSSYGAELAERNSRAARAIVADDRYPFDARLAGDSTAVNRVEPQRGRRAIRGWRGRRYYGPRRPTF